MSDSRARDILLRQSELETERSQYEAVWEAVSEFCDPDAPDIWSGRRGGRADSQAERQERRGSRVYANTINSAANRLAAGLESLIIPQSEKWHGLSTAAMNDDETDEDAQDERTEQPGAAETKALAPGHAAEEGLPQGHPAAD